MNEMDDLLKKRMVVGHLLNVLPTPEAYCLYCESARLVRHVHIIARDGTVVNPFEGLPETLPVSCYKCDSTLGEFIICSQCHTVAYCGLKCQLLSWPSHRSECSPYAKLISSGSENFYLSQSKPARKMKQNKPERESEPEPARKMRQNKAERASEPEPAPESELTC